jgi:hypothetical protein
MPAWTVVLDEGAPVEILAGGDGFEMSWIDTAAVSTQMVDLEPFRDWPDEQLVCDPVGQRSFARGRSHGGVSSVRMCAVPSPASFTLDGADFEPGTKVTFDVHGQEYT